MVNLFDWEAITYNRSALIVGDFLRRDIFAQDIIVGTRHGGRVSFPGSWSLCFWMFTGQSGSPQVSRQAADNQVGPCLALLTVTTAPQALSAHANLVLSKWLQFHKECPVPTEQVVGSSAYLPPHHRISQDCSVLSKATGLPADVVIGHLMSMGQHQSDGDLRGAIPSKATSPPINNHTVPKAQASHVRGQQMSSTIVLVNRQWWWWVYQMLAHHHHHSTNQCLNHSLLVCSSINKGHSTPHHYQYSRVGSHPRQKVC